MHPKVTDLCARGYCVLESVYGENERRQIRRWADALASSCTRY